MKKIYLTLFLLVKSIYSFGYIYRTISSGNFNSPSVWEYSSNGSTWTNATIAPTDGTHSCIIQNGHTVTLNQDVILNDNNPGAAPSITVAGTLIFDNHFLQGEAIQTGSSIFTLEQNATLEIKNSNGLRNASIGALRSFAVYNFHPLANYIFSSNNSQQMYLGIDSSVHNLTINATNIVNSAENIIIYGSFIYRLVSPPIETK